MKYILKFLFLLSSVLLISACAQFPKTDPLKIYDSSKGYRYSNLNATENKDDLFVILSFSGGGTRAAALSYGVLEKLRTTTVEIEGQKRNLLKEIDLISSVSGGSFTAAYYGVFGDDIFTEGNRFQENFLYYNVKNDLFLKLFNPYNWARLASPTFGRIEIATELYKDLIFGEADFHSLVRRRTKPFLMINATDMTKGSQFTFIQSQFDPICADLGSVSIARAVAASSNFPVAFTPLTLDSYPGACEYIEPRWVENALKDLGNNPRRYYRARMLRTYQETQRRYVHLLDGGVADNIGLRNPLTSLRSNDPDLSIINLINLEEIKKLVFIVVDARNETKPDFDESPHAPGTLSVVNSIATTPLDNYSFDTVELLQDTLRRRDDVQRMNSDLHQVEIYRIYVGFDQIEDKDERDKFFSIGTSFNLAKENVDELRRKAGELLSGSQCFKQLTGAVAETNRMGCL
ncbi:MAG: patatin-like phospholipase family protein [Nitrospirota bacterium]